MFFGILNDGFIEILSFAGVTFITSLSAATDGSNDVSYTLVSTLWLSILNTSTLYLALVLPDLWSKCPLNPVLKFKSTLVCLSDEYTLKVFSIPLYPFTAFDVCSANVPSLSNHATLSNDSFVFVARVLTSDRNNIYLLFLSNDCSPIYAAARSPKIFIVSTGNTPLSVTLAIANFPALPSSCFTAFQPPNSVISATLPAVTLFSAPKVFISCTFLLFSI